jgi:mono/diheme cytochrome c family protein
MIDGAKRLIPRSLDVCICALLAAFGPGMQPVFAAGDFVAARKEFQTLCAPCHGVTGRGNGPVATSLSTPPADLTQISKHNDGTFPRARVFVTIVGVERPAAHGTREMPVWGNIFVGEAVGSGVTIEDARRAAAEVEKRIDGLVAYIESIQESN